MNSNTNEKAIEDLIERTLTGNNYKVVQGNSSAGMVEEDKEFYRGGNGYFIGFKEDYNQTYAIDTKRFWSFLESTQAEELSKLKKTSSWQQKILDRYDRLVKKYGLLHILKNGIELDGVKLTMFYQLPLTNSNDKVIQKFESNEFSVTRQVAYNLNNNQTIDMVIFLNGLPICSVELKNHWTGQTARYHGINQYKSRDFRQPLLNFGRCLVHFAVDTEEAFMTTKLEGNKTFFLPFNKGHLAGQGNPPNPFGHKTSYLWEEIFTRQSLANIIQHFVRLDGKTSASLETKTLFFPRYHQLDVVRKIVDDIKINGIGKKYLIQHSAGSGKSNSITWLAFHLIEIYPTGSNIKGFKGLHLPLFDSIVVVTDRRLLDRQITNNIKSFTEVKNIVESVETSKELKISLENGKKIIITTLQKFPFILDGMADMSDRNFGIIIDEAHSSQGGSTSNKMNRVLGQEEIDEDEEDIQDKILRIIEAQRMKGNASYFAFTATPKQATLEKFGVKQPDGSFKEFHLYSMKQAIQEGFILDVLSNYTTYKSYYQIVKTIEDNPDFNPEKAQKVLRSYVEGNAIPIKTKSEIIIEHFINNVFKTKRLKGKAKGMVVTKNIESAIRYYNSMKDILKELGSPFKILIAFSGSKKVDGIEYSEQDMNNVPETKTRETFDDDDYRLLVVANKYLTGFDQPKLCSMYVDKKLQDVMAVQALSRLNRTAPSLGKRTEDLFVLDFFNSVDDIKISFDKYYTSTLLAEETDPNFLYDLKYSLDESGIYTNDQIIEFNTLFFNGAEHEVLTPIIDISAEMFNNTLELDDDDKADIKIKVKQFIKIYGQISSIIPFANVEWEMLFWYLKFLVPKLKVVDKEKDKINEILESVDLTTYGLERTRISSKIILDESEVELPPTNTNVRGTHPGPVDLDQLDEIINEFNQRWFEGWDESPKEQKVRFIRIAEAIKNHRDFNVKFQDYGDIQNKKLALSKIMDEVMLGHKSNDSKFYKKYTEEEFKKSIMDSMIRYFGFM